MLRRKWLANYASYKLMLLTSALGIAGPLLAIWLTKTDRVGLAFVVSAIGTHGIVPVADVSMFPFLMASNIMLQASLTIWTRPLVS